MELSEDQEPGRNSSGQAEKKIETLHDTLAKVEAKVLADTQGEKLQEVKIQTFKTQWKMCKEEALVNLLANMVTEVDGQTSLETLVKVKAEALVVENEEALAKKLTHKIT